MDHTIPISDSAAPATYTIEVYDDDGKAVQLEVTREGFEQFERIRVLRERLKKEPFEWKSEEERLQALSWMSDNEEEDMIKAGCVKWRDE